jgi:hypothetical protein
VLARGNKFGVHHNSGDASVSIIERVDLRDDEHLEDGTCKGGRERAREFVALPEGSADEGWFDEEEAAGFVLLFFEFSGPFLGAAFENDSVSTAEKVQIFIGGASESAHLAGIRDDPVGAEDVVCVGWPVGGDALVESDLDGLIDGEAGAFDVVGEVGLEEREIPVAAGSGIGEGTNDRRAVLERALELLEELEPFGVVGLSACARSQTRRVAARLACAECASDQRVDQLKLPFEFELRRECARAVAQAIDAVEAALGDQAVDPVFKLRPSEGARDAAAATASKNGVLKQSAWLGSEPQVVAESQPRPGGLSGRSARGR